MSTPASSTNSHARPSLIEEAWLAGLLEGEGCFGVSNDRSHGNRYRYPIVQVVMTDEDVVRRACAVSGVGFVLGPYRPAGHGIKDVWRWHVKRRADVLWLMQAVLPFMGRRRSERIEAVLMEFGNGVAA